MSSTLQYPWTSAATQPPPLHGRLLSSVVKSKLGAIAYTLLAGFIGSLFVLFRLVTSPSKFFKVVSREHLAEKLQNPALGRHLFLKANGISIHAVSLGNPKDPLMLFVHGFPEFWYSWKNQMATFSKKGFRCVAIDMRGYGDSEKPAGIGSYSLRDHLTEDLQDVIMALGHEKAAAVVAHDWGAIVAYAFAAKYPESLDKLIIINGPHPVIYKARLATYPQVLKSMYVFLFQLPKLPEFGIAQSDFQPLTVVFSGGRKQVISREDLELYKYSLAKPGALTASINYYRNLARSSVRWIGNIKVPTLVIWGVKDPFLALTTNAGLEKVVEDLTVKTLEGCGHWTPAEKPDEVNRHIEEYLTKRSH